MRKTIGKRCALVAIRSEHLARLISALCMDLHGSTLVLYILPKLPFVSRGCIRSPAYLAAGRSSLARSRRWLEMAARACVISRSGLRASIRTRRGHLATREGILVPNAITLNRKTISGKQQSNSMCLKLCFRFLDSWEISSVCAQFMEMVLFLVSFSGCIV